VFSINTPPVGNRSPILAVLVMKSDSLSPKAQSQPVSPDPFDLIPTSWINLGLPNLIISIDAIKEN